MPSGSYWSRDKGFKLVDHNYSDIDTHINEAIKKHQHIV